MKQMIKNTLILTAITLVSGLLLGFVYEITKGPIARSKELAKQKAYQEVMQDADSFVEFLTFDASKAQQVLENANISGCVVNGVVEAQKQGEIVGYVITITTTEGYGGEIQISIGIYADGKVSGIAILSINETAGLGMNAKEPEFYGQFANKNETSFEVTNKDAMEENQIEAISGATITSKAVTNAVNAGVTYFHQVIGGVENE